MNMVPHVTGWSDGLIFPISKKNGALITMGRNGDFMAISYEKLDKKIDSTRTQDLKANYFGRLIQHMLQKE